MEYADVLMHRTLDAREAAEETPECKNHGEMTYDHLSDCWTCIDCEIDEGLDWGIYSDIETAYMIIRERLGY